MSGSAKRAVVVIFGAILIGAWFCLGYVSTFDPYQQRALGAHGICPVIGYSASDDEGHRAMIYECTTEEQRLAAADKAAPQLHLLRGLSSVFIAAGAALGASTLIRAIPTPRAREDVRLH